jgi:hypothetical protein
MLLTKKCLLLLIFSLGMTGPVSAQFIDNFNGPSLPLDKSGVNGWAFFTGDGAATMDLRAGKGYASVLVDATQDQRGIWWALIKRRVSPSLNLSRLSRPGFELRIEARVRSSHAPRRVNLHLNTQRTTDFHSHLMEFEIPDTTGWHTISMTTRDFDAKPGDDVFAQMALMDWGLEKYRVDIDYFRVDVVNRNTAGPDKGIQIPYHPPVPDLKEFTHHLPVAHDALVDVQYPDMNFNRWVSQDQTFLLTVSGTQYVILRWDLSAFSGKRVAQAGLLELTTQSLQRNPDQLKDFGLVRVVELMGGDPYWNQDQVTFNSLVRGEPFSKISNTQMIIDLEVNPEQGGTTLFTIPRSVLQRMINGKTLGIAVLPLGAVNASFFAQENQDKKLIPKLHVRFESEPGGNVKNERKK